MVAEIDDSVAVGVGGGFVDGFGDVVGVSDEICEGYPLCVHILTHTHICISYMIEASV